MGTLLQNSHWDVLITIGSYTVPKSLLSAEYPVVIRKSEDGANTCDFTLQDVPDPIAFIDKIYKNDQKVIIQYIHGDSIKRLVTAIVDKPKIDLFNRTVSVSCSNHRDDLIKEKMGTLVQSLGYYSKPIFGKSQSLLDQVNQRLSTIPSSLDFDSYNNVMITSWFAKADPDFTYNGGGDIRKFETPQIDWQDRGSITNFVNVKLNYKRTRLYELVRNFDWTASYYGNQDDFIQYAYSAPTINMVETAINQTTWKLQTNATFVTQYPLFAGLNGLTYLTGPIKVLDSNGDPVTDAKGDPLYKNATAEQKLSQLVMKADFTLAKRFSQFINEEFNITVKAPQSIAQNHKLDKYDNVSYEDSYDASAWEAFDKVTPAPAGAQYQGDNYYVDFDEQNPGTLANSFIAVINKAKTDILRTHRGTTVRFRISRIASELELKHTVKINTSKLVAKGKVIDIKHTLDLKDGDCYTDVVIAIFRSQGSATATPINPPTRMTYTPSLTEGQNISLGNHYNEDPETSYNSYTWNGFIGTKLVSVPLTVDGTPVTDKYMKYRPEFTDTFIVDTPPISDYLRAMKTLTQSSTYNIVIPNDLLELEF